MPYITGRQKQIIVSAMRINLQTSEEKDASKVVEELGAMIASCGEFNWFVTKLAHGYLAKRENYQAYNDLMGALEGVKLELYRKKCSIYEDEKERINGSA